MDNSRRKTLYENIHALRKHPCTSRVGHLYSDKNDTDIMEDAAKGRSIADIAKKQKRTVNAIKLRIIINAVKEMQLRRLNLHDVCCMYNISDAAALERHYRRVCDKQTEVTKMFRHI